MFSLQTSEYQYANSVAESQCVPEQNAMSSLSIATHLQIGKPYTWSSAMLLIFQNEKEPKSSLLSLDIPITTKYFIKKTL